MGDEQSSTSQVGGFAMSPLLHDYCADDKQYQIAITMLKQHKQHDVLSFLGACPGLGCVVFVVAVPNESVSDKRNLLALISTVLIVATPGLFGLAVDDGEGEETARKKRKPCLPHRNRTRKRVVDVFDELGPC